MFSTSPTRPTASTFALRPASVAIRPITVPAPAMSHFMSSIPPAGLMLMPPVSKVTPLPMNATGFSFAFRRTAGNAVPLHHHHAGLVDTALGNSQQRAESQLAHLLRTEDVDLQAEFGQLAAAIGHFRRIEDIGRLADEIAGEKDPLGGGVQRLPRRFRLGEIGGQHGDLGQLGLVLRLLLGAVPVETVRAQHRAERDLGGLRCAQGSTATATVVSRGRVLEIVPPASSRVLCVNLSRFAETDRQHTGQSAARRQNRTRLALGALEFRHLEARLMAPPVTSSTCCQRPDGCSPSCTSSASAPDFGRAGLAKAISSMVLYSSVGQAGA